MSDYYIRSWDPDSTYPANPQEGDVCYTITLDQSWAPVAGVKNDNLVKEEVYENGEWKEVGGGGGGGDVTWILEPTEFETDENGSATITGFNLEGLSKGEQVCLRLKEIEDDEVVGEYYAYANINKFGGNVLFGSDIYESSSAPEPDHLFHIAIDSDLNNIEMTYPSESPVEYFYGEIAIFKL